MKKVMAGKGTEDERMKKLLADLNKSTMNNDSGEEGAMGGEASESMGSLHTPEGDEDPEELQMSKGEEDTMDGVLSSDPSEEEEELSDTGRDMDDPNVEPAGGGKSMRKGLFGHHSEPAFHVIIAVGKNKRKK